MPRLFRGLWPVRNTFVQFEAPQAAGLRRSSTWHCRPSDAGTELSASDTDTWQADAAAIAEQPEQRAQKHPIPFPSLALPAWALPGPDDPPLDDSDTDSESDGEQLPTVWARPPLFRRPKSFSNLCILEDTDASEDDTACSTPEASGKQRWADLVDSDDEESEEDTASSTPEFASKQRWADIDDGEADTEDGAEDTFRKQGSGRSWADLADEEEAEDASSAGLALKPQAKALR